MKEAKGFKPHPDKAEADRLLPAIQEYQALAVKHGISDIFQDNGGKLLQVLLILGLEVIPGREGNDATDVLDAEDPENPRRQYELKSVNLALQDTFTTHHHLNHVILEKYRRATWIFATYQGIDIQEIYRVEPAALAKYFDRWEARLRDTRVTHINNPKIPVSHIRRHGELIYGQAPAVRPRAKKRNADPPGPGFL
jgi:hypothetical protein